MQSPRVGAFSRGNTGTVSGPSCPIHHSKIHHQGWVTSESAQEFPACPIYPIKQPHIVLHHPLLLKTDYFARKAFGLEPLKISPLPDSPKEATLHVSDAAGRSVFFGVLDTVSDLMFERWFGHFSLGHISMGLLVGVLFGGPSIRHARRLLILLAKMNKQNLPK